MVSETLTLVENALKNPTYGVNTFLTGSITGIYSELDTYWVVIGGEPNNFPVLIVTLASDVDFTMPEVRTSIRDVQIPVAISYWNKIEDTPTGMNIGYNALYAITKTLRQWTKNENAADRISGNIQIVELVNMRQTPRAVSENQDVNVLASLIVTLRVRDVNP